MIYQGVIVFAPRDYYHFLEEDFKDLLKKAGIPFINELFEKAREKCNSSLPGPIRISINIASIESYFPKETLCA